MINLLSYVYAVFVMLFFLISKHIIVIISLQNSDSYMFQSNESNTTFFHEDCQYRIEVSKLNSMI